MWPLTEKGHAVIIAADLTKNQYVKRAIFYKPELSHLLESGWQLSMVTTHISMAIRGAKTKNGKWEFAHWHPCR